MAGGRRRILVIEDDPETAEQLVDFLSTSGYQVDLAGDGNDGLSRGSSADYAVMTIDRMLPDTDGLAVIRRLREDRILTPALIVSALGEIDDRVRGLRAGGDDYAMMREVFRRRFYRALKEDPERAEEHWPDLVLIDGGQGQLEVARQVLAELGLEDIATVGIAKGPDRDAGRERFFVPGKPPFSLEPRDPVLYFLQRLRDEAHRFAIGTHRARRAADITRSALDEVPGIGSGRKRALLHHFGSARAVAVATLEDIKAVPGISGALAQKIHDHFRGGR